VRKLVEREMAQGVRTKTVNNQVEVPGGELFGFEAQGFVG